MSLEEVAWSIFSCSLVIGVFWMSCQFQEKVHVTCTKLDESEEELNHDDLVTLLFYKARAKETETPQPPREDKDDYIQLLLTKIRELDIKKTRSRQSQENASPTDIPVLSESEMAILLQDYKVPEDIIHMARIVGSNPKRETISKKQLIRRVLFCVQMFIWVLNEKETSEL
jgi:hypothetical protein